MPVVLRIKGYRFWFYEADLDEPPHVHVGKESKEAKYWITPIALAVIVHRKGAKSAKVVFLESKY